jgi:protein involved in polysaccharide export with SLBB domain
MLAARKQFKIDQGTMNAVPPTGNPGVAVLEMTLPDNSFAITALNYGRNSASVQVDLTLIPPGIPAMQVAGQTAQDIVANQSDGTVGSDGKLSINLDALAGKTLVVHRQGATGTATSTPPAPTTPSVVGSVQTPGASTH